jgi:hypothetical protein
MSGRKPAVLLDYQRVALDAASSKVALEEAQNFESA